MKRDKDAVLTQRKELCDHPEELCVRDSEDASGMFYIYCKKCDTLFNRYKLDELFENRKKYGDKNESA